MHPIPKTMKLIKFILSPNEHFSEYVYTFAT
jgi:hypothetical protein